LAPHSPPIPKGRGTCPDCWPQPRRPSSAPSRAPLARYGNGPKAPKPRSIRFVNHHSNFCVPSRRCRMPSSASTAVLIESAHRKTRNHRGGNSRPGLRCTGLGPDRPSTSPVPQRMPSPWPDTSGARAKCTADQRCAAVIRWPPTAGAPPRAQGGRRAVGELQVSLGVSQADQHVDQKQPRSDNQPHHRLGTASPLPSPALSR
jgi:hypothetical protein